MNRDDFSLHLKDLQHLPNLNVGHRPTITGINRSTGEIVFSHSDWFSSAPPPVPPKKPFPVLNLFIGLLLLAHVLVAAQLAFVQHTLEARILWDIDAARSTVLNESNFMFMQGCYGGVSYRPTEPPVSGYDQNSPTNFCNQKRDHWHDYILELAEKIGRPEKK